MTKKTYLACAFYSNCVCCAPLDTKSEALSQTQQEFEQKQETEEAIGQNLADDLVLDAKLECYDHGREHQQKQKVNTKNNHQLFYVQKQYNDTFQVYKDLYYDTIHSYCTFRIVRYEKNDEIGFCLLFKKGTSSLVSRH